VNDEHEDDEPVDETDTALRADEPAPQLPRSWPTWLAFGLLVAGVVVGATQLAFLCDDAYIFFRYVSNAHDGHGLVWNQQPFEPVEGYTSMLWVLMLWATWSWTGVAPPDAANALSIGLGVLLFLTLVLYAFRRVLGPQRWPIATAFCALLFVASNRTFLQWMTSGLETSLFNLLFVVWALLGCRAPSRQSTGWLAAWSALAACMSLARPDGLLFVGATTTFALWDLARKRRWPSEVLLGLSPLLITLTHVTWRFWFYGEWLPNTYYAKVGDAWPEAGLRYLLGFAIEHGLWLWGLLVCCWLTHRLLVLRLSAFRAIFDQLATTAVVSATIVHVATYVLLVGGDHFEYRVLSHLVPLLGVSAGAMVVTMWRGAVAAQVTALSLLVLAGSVGWVHYACTIGQPRVGPHYQPVADRLPDWLRPLSRRYDRNQAWLQLQLICVRCPQHALSLEAIWRQAPERQRIDADPQDLPVIKTTTAGVPAWVVPDVAVIDLLGLNDWVIARNDPHGSPVPFLPREQLLAAAQNFDVGKDRVLAEDELHELLSGVYGVSGPALDDVVALWQLLFDLDDDRRLTFDELAASSDFFASVRFMAHGRKPPEGYVEAFDDNVTFVDGALVVRPRDVPLTAHRVREIEAQWRAEVRAR